MGQPNMVHMCSQWNKISNVKSNNQLINVFKIYVTNWYNNIIHVLRKISRSTPEESILYFVWHNIKKMWINMYIMISARYESNCICVFVCLFRWVIIKWFVLTVLQIIFTSNVLKHAPLPTYLIAISSKTTKALKDIFFIKYKTYNIM